MKLYYSPGACSQAVHIVLCELSLPFELVAVELSSKRTKSGADYLKVNPKGYVPALELDDGTILTEVPAILEYLAERTTPARLAPEPRTPAHYRLIEWLAFISSEVHKPFGPLFKQDGPAPAKESAKTAIARRFDDLEQALTGREYLLGAEFGIADAYLYVVVGWSRYVGLELGRWPRLKRYHARIGARAAVQAAEKAEHGG